jgi:hypothetical protein
MRWGPQLRRVDLRRGARGSFDGRATTPDILAGPLDVATLPPFSNQRGCPRCDVRCEIRVHLDRDCARVRGDHFHRMCRCGHEWLEQCGERPWPGSAEFRD